MRHVFEHPDEARARGERARADLRERHSPEAAGKVMRARLERVRGGFATGRAVAAGRRGRSSRSCATARPAGR